MLREPRDYRCRYLPTPSIWTSFAECSSICCFKCKMQVLTEYVKPVLPCRKPITPGASGGFDNTNVTTVSRWTHHAQGSLLKEKSKRWSPPGSNVEQDLDSFGIAPRQGKKPILCSLCPIKHFSSLHPTISTDPIIAHRTKMMPHTVV